jgi:hypothetical protein
MKEPAVCRLFKVRLRYAKLENTSQKFKTSLRYDSLEATFQVNAYFFEFAITKLKKNVIILKN